MQRILPIVLALLLVLILTACPADKHASPPARLTLLVSGNTTGYLRNCGCASGQYGGELRRARVLKQEREEALKSKVSDKGRGSAVLSIDQGSTLDGDEYIERLYSRQILKSMARTGYDMIGIGEHDLLFGQQDLYSYLLEVQEEQTAAGEPFLPLTAVNLHFGKPAEGPDNSAELNRMIEKYRIVDIGNGYRVGLIHAIDQGVALETVDDGQSAAAYYGFTVSDPAKAAETVLMQHGKEADLWIFSLADGIQGSTDPQGIADLKGLDLVIGFTSGNPNKSAGDTSAIKPLFLNGPILKARDLVKIVVTFPADPAEDPTITGQQLAVGSNIKGDDYVLSLIDDIYPEIEMYEKELLKTEVQRPSYVGQENCVTCHNNILNAMLQTKHQQSFKSLEARAKADPEQANAPKDPNCLRCHVTGYNSLHGGWNKLKPNPKLQLVSCEVCHGPAEYHVMKMSGTPVPDDFNEEGRNEFGLLPAGPDTCKQCHDAENSPKFNFEEYWGQIRHSKDMPLPDEAPPPASED